MLENFVIDVMFCRDPGSRPGWQNVRPGWQDVWSGWQDVWQNVKTLSKNIAVPYA